MRVAAQNKPWEYETTRPRTFFLYSKDNEQERLTPSQWVSCCCRPTTPRQKIGALSVRGKSNPAAAEASSLSAPRLRLGLPFFFFCGASSTRIHVLVSNYMPANGKPILPKQDGFHSWTKRSIGISTKLANMDRQLSLFDMFTTKQARCHATGTLKGRLDREPIITFDISAVANSVKTSRAS